MNKIYLDPKLSKIENHLPDIENKYNEVEMRNDKQSGEEVLIERVVKTTIQIRNDIGLFDHYNNGDERKHHLFTERLRESFLRNAIVTK